MIDYMEKMSFRFGLYERLSGLRVETFCIMGSHFHILVEVPKQPETLPPEEALVALVSATKGKDEAFWLNYWLTHGRKEGDHSAAEAERERWFRQMWGKERNGAPTEICQENT